MNKEQELKDELTQVANLAIDQAVEIYQLEMKVISLERDLNKLKNLNYEQPREAIPSKRERC